MRIGVSIPVSKLGGYPSMDDRKALLHEALDGRFGDWLKMHDLLKEAQIMETAMFVVFDCDESQYLECLLTWDGVYQVEIITR